MKDYQYLHIKHDTAAGLYALIVIHSLKHGPALGGCRVHDYASFDEALSDAVRLAQGMSYKAAMCGLPFGGGKAVIFRPQAGSDHSALFKSFAEFVNSLQGNYITTFDSGLKTTDINIIARHTNYISGHAQDNSNIENPAPFTAAGIIKGMLAAVKFKLKRTALEGLHIAIQGVGQVGYRLVEILSAQGVNITLCDNDASRAEQCAAKFGAMRVAPDKIYEVSCDIFAPCGLGGTLRPETIAILNTEIVAGCANNQLADAQCGSLLHKRNILYVPDYIINAGGLIKVAGQYSATSPDLVTAKVDSIASILSKIFASSLRNNIATNLVADARAAALLA